MYNVQCTLYCTTYRCWISHFGQEKATVTSYIWKWANTYTKHYWHTVLHHSRNTNKNNNLVCNAKLGTRQIVGSCNKRLPGLGSCNNRLWGFRSCNKQLGGFGSCNKQLGGFGSCNKRLRGCGSCNKRLWGIGSWNEQLGGFGSCNKLAASGAAASKTQQIHLLTYLPTAHTYSIAVYQRGII